MAGSSRRGGGGEGYTIPGEDAGEPLINTRGLEAFGRKVTTTAGHLIGPLADPSTSSHYQNAMADLHKQLRRPNLQRSIFSFARTTPTDLVRSKLSTSEIQSRALTYIPDELLANIPDDDSTYSLFEGFKATVPELEKEDKKHKRKMSRGRKLLEDRDNVSVSSSDGPSGLYKLKKQKAKMDHKFQMLGIRKNMATSEIREIDKKIANLNKMRRVVFDRLEGLEDEEAAMEQELIDLEEKLEDAQEVHDIATGRGETTSTRAAGDERATSPDEATMDAGFMSESIYQKLPSSESAESAPTKIKRQRPIRKRSMPVLHEHFEPGAKIQELQAHGDTVTALDFDVPFGTMVTASLDDTVKVWDLQAGRCLGLLEGHTASVRALQVEDNICATGSMDATVRLWDLSRARYDPEIDNRVNKKEEEEEVEESFFDLAPKPKEPETPPSGSMDDTPLFTLEAHVDEVTALYFKDQTLISGSADKTLRQWDLEKGRCVQTLDVMWAAAQASATLGSSEGTWRNRGQLSDTTADFVGALQVFDAALACGTADGMVRLWDLRSGQVHKSLVGHTGPVTCLQFDDVHLVTGSLDRSIRIWDLRTGSIFDAYAYDHPITSMMFDNRRIVSAAGENVVKVYDKSDGRHWDCGAGATLNSPAVAEGQAKNPAIVDRVRIKDGYLAEGRRDGVVGVWTC